MEEAQDLGEQFVDGAYVPLVRRSLTDGRQCNVVKAFWRAADLEFAIRGLGWTVAVHPAGPVLLGEGARSGESAAN